MGDNKLLARLLVQLVRSMMEAAYDHTGGKQTVQDPCENFAGI